MHLYWPEPVNVNFEMTTRHTVVSDRGLDQAGFFSKGSAGKLDRYFLLAIGLLPAIVDIQYEY